MKLSIYSYSTYCSWLYCTVLYCTLILQYDYDYSSKTQVAKPLYDHGESTGPSLGNKGTGGWWRCRWGIIYVIQNQSKEPRESRKLQENEVALPWHMACMSRVIFPSLLLLSPSPFTTASNSLLFRLAYWVLLIPRLPWRLSSWVSC
jgi:hypothetical protein